MGTRLDLHEIFCSTLGSRNVYFQPPETIKMNYPCIVYERASNDTRFADNRPYKSIRRYTVTIIDKNPDSQLPDKLGELPLCRLNRVYTADNLNHYVFDIYF
mgnify:FL=1